MDDKSEVTSEQKPKGSSSSSDSSSDSESNSSSSNSSSSASSSDSDSDSSSSSESEDEENVENEASSNSGVSKKRPSEVDSESNKKAKREIPATPEPELKEGQRKHFSRIDRSKIKFEDSVLQDNTYKGAAGTWGQMANERLMQVRGKDFTKNKNKMKKGSYRGGSITMASGSYKFTD
ncbi:hypothetical protein QG37_05146 [Candidozyma auris]|nr:hypothetical protein QG37_05146 [[Candida] auris]